MQSKTIAKDVTVETSHDFELPAAAVWDLIAGFDTLPDYHASVPASRLSQGGAVRHLTISEEAGGGTVVERLVSFDDEAMTFSYRIIELIDSPMPFRDYQAWVKLEATGENSCTLHWNSSFNVEGTSKEEAEELARVIYQGCFDGITRVLTKDVSVETSHEFKLPASAVWGLIAGFDTLPDYHASVPASRLSHGGAVRHLTISEEAGGGFVVERLVYFNHEAMTFSYKIIELIDSPMPFRNYQAWVKLESTGEHSCKLHWNSSFNVEGASKEEAEELARVIYQGCYDGIERVLSAE
jgi:organic hydroperoxide reductase OsmC/OhrA